MDFLKGHGTENDFVVLPDPEASLDLTPSSCPRAVRPAARASAPTACCGSHARALGGGVLATSPTASRRRLVHGLPQRRRLDRRDVRQRRPGVRALPRAAGLVAERPVRRRIAAGARRGRGASRDDPDARRHRGHGPRAGRGRATASAVGRRRGDLSPGWPSTSATRTWPAWSRPDAPRLARLDLTRRPRFDDLDLFPHGREHRVPHAAAAPSGATVRMRVHERGVGRDPVLRHGNRRRRGRAALRDRGGGRDGDAWIVRRPRRSVTGARHRDGDGAVLRGPSDRLRRRGADLDGTAGLMPRWE